MVSPNVPVCQALKEKIKLAIERSSRRVGERFRDAMLYRPKLQNLKLLKAKVKRRFFKLESLELSLETIFSLALKISISEKLEVGVEDSSS
uniref:Uncharacterized protein n=1 Tax=Solanum tuberosum TaxID=4113 RepID=M1DKA6_SOLTU